MPEASPDTVRLDKWLWAVRLYRTRTEAATACRLGQVKVAEQEAKASRSIQVGDIVSLEKNRMKRTVEVVSLLEKRVGAKLIADYYEDHTPEEEWTRARSEQEALKQNRVYLEKGIGRPTKQKRRLMDRFLDDVRNASDN